MTNEQFAKLRKALFAQMRALGMNKEGNNSIELYLEGFATVQCSVSFWDNTITMERYYDSEHLVHRNQTHVLPIDASATALEFATKLIASIRGDESIFSGLGE